MRNLRASCAMLRLGIRAKYCQHECKVHFYAIHVFYAVHVLGVLHDRLFVISSERIFNIYIYIYVVYND